jgi:zinc protease
MREDLIRHYHTHFGPQGAVIAVVGAVSPSAVIERLHALLGQWPPQVITQEPPVPLDALPPLALRRNVNLPGRPQIELVIGVLGMLEYTEEYYTASVANAILSDLGMLGRLGETLREKRGLVYHINSDLYTGQIRRPWIISAGVSLATLEEAIRAIEEEIALMRDEPVQEEELLDAQALLTGSLPLFLETNEGIASLLLTIEAYNLGLDYLERYPLLIRSVTPESIQAVMRKYWPEGRYIIAAAGTLA